MNKYDAFLPVDPDFYDIANTFIDKYVKVFYFGVDKNVEESKGNYMGIVTRKDGEFLHIKTDEKVRIDRIISINGKLGPAFDEYDAYANACLSCMLGYEHNNGN